MGTVEPIVVCHEALDSSCTLQEFVSRGRTLSGDSFGFPTAGGSDYAYYSPQWVWAMADKAIRIYRDQRGIRVRDHQSTASVIGFRIYASIDSVIAILSLIRMGHTILLIAPTLAPDRVRQLLEESGCKLVVNGLPDLGCRAIPVPTVEQLRDIDTDSGDGEVCWLPPRRTKVSDDVAIMIHSSTSTGPPKLVSKSHRALLMTLRGIPSVFHDKSFFMGSWLHWMAGFSGLLFCFIRSGVRTSWAREDAADATAEKILVQTKPQVVWVQPVFVYEAAKSVVGVEALRRCIMVVTVGGVLSTYTADRLLRAGVRLATEYGMTEAPFGMSSAASAGDAQYWDYVQPDPESAPHLHFRPLDRDEGSVWAGGEQLFELVILPSLPTMERKWANREDGSLHTGDLFVKHPHQKRYKCLGRWSDKLEIDLTSDGVVMVRSRTYEDAVESRHADIVDATLLAGSRRHRPAMLVFVKHACQLSDRAILQNIWTTVDRELNGHVPVPLAKEMIVVVRDARMPRTPKGEVMRAEASYKFRSIIDRAYEGTVR